VFVDDVVEGMTFATVTETGETDADGTFTYRTGERIVFSIGGIEIGDGDARPVMTPVDLVRDEDPTAVDETNDRVTNIARFLQTLDDDGDPSDGILITRAVRETAVFMALDFDQPIADFGSHPNVQAAVASLTSATSAGVRVTVPVLQAQSRLHETLLIAPLAGCYAGTFEGVTRETYLGHPTPRSGTFTFDVHADGTATGDFSGTTRLGTAPLSGRVRSDGRLILTKHGSSTGEVILVSVSGVISGGGVSGSWRVEINDRSLDSGRFSGEVGCH
jgi:hypothetical protein